MWKRNPSRIYAVLGVCVFVVVISVSPLFVLPHPVCPSARPSLALSDLEALFLWTECQLEI